MCVGRRKRNQETDRKKAHVGYGRVNGSSGAGLTHNSMGICVVEGGCQGGKAGKMVLVPLYASD